MRALFVSVYSDTPHFETELELMSELLTDGHAVHVLRCRGELQTCLKNPDHREGWCRICTSKIDAGLSTLPDANVEELRAAKPDKRLPRVFESAEALKAFTIDGVDLGRGVYSTMCGRAKKDTHFDTRAYASMIRRELETAWSVYVGVRDTIARIKPDRVYVFNGRFATTYAAVVAAQKAGVTFFTHERGGSTDRYLLRENALPHDIEINTAEIEQVWAAGSPDKEAVARRWFVERRNGVERSWESFTKAQTVGMLPPGFDQTRRNIAIYNSTLEEYASIRGWEHPYYTDEVVGLARIVGDMAKARPDTHLYLRIHPHMKGIERDDNYQLRAYAELERTAKNLTIIWPESPVHTYELIDRSKLVLTFGSTVGAEACFWGTPSILSGRSLYEKLDCAHVTKSHDEVIRLLSTDYPPAKEQSGALKYGYWETLRGQPYRRFRPTGLYTGDWLGRPCRASMSARLQNIVLTRLGR